VARWTVRKIAAIPTVAGDFGPGDPDWFPLQHALGIDTFGVNLFAATRPNQELVEEHDERESQQQELYVVLDGEAAFYLDGKELRLREGTAVAVTDPSVRRRVTAVTEGTRLLIIGAGPSAFASSWNPRHFADIPRPE
jgi:hypothetical protein